MSTPNAPTREEVERLVTRCSEFVAYYNSKHETGHGLIDSCGQALRALLDENERLQKEVAELSTPDLFGPPNGECGYERGDLWCVGVDEMNMNLGDVKPCGWANRVLDPGWLAFVHEDEDAGHIEWFATKAEADTAVAVAREAAAIDAAREGV